MRMLLKIVLVGFLVLSCGCAGPRGGSFPRSGANSKSESRGAQIRVWKFEPISDEWICLTGGTLAMTVGTGAPRDPSWKLKCTDAKGNELEGVTWAQNDSSIVLITPTAGATVVVTPSKVGEFTLVVRTDTRSVTLSGRVTEKYGGLFMSIWSEE